MMDPASADNAETYATSIFRLRRFADWSRIYRPMATCSHCSRASTRSSLPLTKATLPKRGTRFFGSREGQDVILRRTYKSNIKGSKSDGERLHRSASERSAPVEPGGGLRDRGPCGPCAAN